MKYHLWTIGCQYNEWDGARLKFFLDQNGLTESTVEDANLVIVVACSVRQTAVDRIFGHIKNWQNQLKNLSPDDLEMSGSRSKHRETEEPKNSRKILITGCVLDTDKKKFAEKGVQFLEPGNFETLEKLLKNTISRSLDGVYPESVEWVRGDSPNKLKSYLPNSCSYVPIMVGCNNFCSYCAVPYVRGREKSRPVEEIIKDVQNIIKYRSSQRGENYAKNFSADKTASKNKSKIEIILLGQNVNSYKINQKSKIKSQKYKFKIKNVKTDFTELLEKINDLEGDFKVGFMSNHPKDMSNDIIDAVARLSKIKKEIHLPLQSGSDMILKAMNRPYTAEEYLWLVESIKLKVRKVRLTTDIIVGFPGEAEADFQKTVEICKKVKFNQAYINKYSPRSGTVAYKLGDPIPWSEKQHRWRILNEMINK